VIENLKDLESKKVFDPISLDFFQYCSNQFHLKFVEEVEDMRQEYHLDLSNPSIAHKYIIAINLE